MMIFDSTRGVRDLGIADILFSGMANDGGLYLPRLWPALAAGDLAAQSYQDTAFSVLRHFFLPYLSATELQGMIASAYQGFDAADVVAIKKCDPHIHVLELFHGPTLAFKDIALQFLGQLFAHHAKKTGRPVKILGATSGDTGSAAIAAIQNIKGATITMLFPEGGPSDLQRRQMTCVDSDQVQVIAVDGSFDDCQRIVKDILVDQQLASVNSINIARVLAQIVYYVYAAARTPNVHVVVPTGNFGNVYAAYAAKQMGAALGTLLIAHNENDPLYRLRTTGRMDQKPTIQTLSPAMDIQWPSNFERFLYEACGRNATRTQSLMQSAAPQLSAAEMDFFSAHFLIARVSDPETRAAIKDMHQRYDYTLDPHSAVGLAAAEKTFDNQPFLLMATAHPAKFPDVVEKETGLCPTHQHLDALFGKPEKMLRAAANADAIRKIMGIV